MLNIDSNGLVDQRQNNKDIESNDFREGHTNEKLELKEPKPKVTPGRQHRSKSPRVFELDGQKVLQGIIFSEVLKSPRSRRR